jgi:hypothetical protein
MLANKDFSISFNFESANRTELILKVTVVFVVFHFVNILLLLFCTFLIGSRTSSWLQSIFYLLET